MELLFISLREKIAGEARGHSPMILDLLQYLLLGWSWLQLFSQLELSFDVTERDSFKEHIRIANLVLWHTTVLAVSGEGRVTCGRHLV